MTRPLFYTLLLCVVFTGGCKPEAGNSTAANTNAEDNATPPQSLDFNALLSAVDDGIGERFQAMQMDAMNSATYQYDGPIKTVVEIVDPIAKKAGFTAASDPPISDMGEAEREMQAKMGINISSFEQKMYTHPNGDTLMIARMDMSNDEIDMKMLTVQLMNPKKMSDLGAKAKNP